MTPDRRVCLIGCGGTIGASSRLSAFIPVSELLEAYGLVPHLPEGLGVVTVEHDRRSSTEWSPQDALGLVRVIARHASDQSVDGVVVTFGTGTLEETAYLACLTLPPKKPVVFTAAVAPHGHPNSDGGGNLLDALLVAAGSMPPGVYVALHGEVHDAREATKVHSSRIRAFASPEFGPLACVEDGRVRRFRMPIEGEVVPIRELNARVELIKCYLGMGPLLLKPLGPELLDGLVVESLASGQVPPALEEPLIRLRQGGVQVVLSTRCLSGRLRMRERFPVSFPGDEQTLYAAGCLAGFEPGIKARIRLMVGLAAGMTGNPLREWVEEGYSRTDWQLTHQTS